MSAPANDPSARKCQLERSRPVPTAPEITRDLELEPVTCRRMIHRGIFMTANNFLPIIALHRRTVAPMNLHLLDLSAATDSIQLSWEYQTTHPVAGRRAEPTSRS